MNLVDTNVIIDLLRADSPWRDWAQEHLLAAHHDGGLAINPINYAELSAMPQTQAVLDDFLHATSIHVEPLSLTCARLAGQAFLEY